MIKLLMLIFVLLVESSAKKKHEQRVSKGIHAAKHQFPYFAQFRKMLPVNESYYSYAWCSATLINPQWILTAAHCFPNSNKTLNYLIKKKMITVLMGTNIKNDEKAEHKLVIEVHIHNKYMAVYGEGEESDEYVENVENDIAIAKLESLYELGKSINIIKLPQVHKAPMCRKGTVIGIGKTEINSGSSITYAELSETPIEDLHENVPPSNTTFYSKVNWTEGHPLEGDSGGPFVCKFGKISVQYGITSNGYASSDSDGYITQFTDVTKYIDFIIKHLIKVDIYDVEHKRGERWRRMDEANKNNYKLKSNAFKTNYSYFYLMLLYYHIINRK